MRCRLARPGTLPLLTLAAALLLPPGPAEAQSVVACRDRNMNIVTCASGGGGSSYGGGGGSYGGLPPGAGALGTAAQGFGMALGLFLRNLMTDDTDYEALARQEAEQQRQREELLASQRAARQADEQRRQREEQQRQQQFQDGQRELIGQIRPLNGGAAAGVAIRPLGPIVSAPELGVRQLDLSAPAPQGALPQAQAIDANRKDMLTGSLEQAKDAAGKGFDTPQAAGPAGGPLIQVRGVPQPPPAPPPAPAVTKAADPMLQPMSLQQRMLIADGKKAQVQLDALRQRRQRNEVDAETFEREETSLKGLIAKLAQQFQAAAPPPEETVAASAPSPSVPPAASPPPRGLNVMAAAAGDAVGTCEPSDPKIIGCIEIRNTSSERVRVYLHELPDVFCTIEPGSMCSRPAMQGVYNGFAEREDGRRTALATLLHTPAGVRWGIQFP